MLHHFHLQARVTFVNSNPLALTVSQLDNPGLPIQTSRESGDRGINPTTNASKMSGRGGRGGRGRGRGGPPTNGRRAVAQNSVPWAMDADIVLDGKPTEQFPVRQFLPLPPHFNPLTNLPSTTPSRTTSPKPPSSPKKKTNKSPTSSSSANNAKTARSTPKPAAARQPPASATPAAPTARSKSTSGTGK